ncbi:MAG: hypothetical protein GVY32_01120 [Gammaproteobacteria bacterium]|nr:hypothetical protein [Gammaproteobacteria bacterium]
MIEIRSLERWLFLFLLLCTLVPIALREGFFGLPLYGVVLIALYGCWIWRSLYDPCLDARRFWYLLPFAGVALLLALSTWLDVDGDFANYSIWLVGIGLMLYVNQNWGVTIDYRIVLAFALAALAIEVSVAALQVATKTYVGNAVMYFGRGGDVVEDVHTIAGGRVFRPVGTTGLPNQLSILLVMLVTLAVPVVAGKGQYAAWLRGVAIALAFLCLVLVALSTSRGSVILLAAVPLLFSLLHALRSNALAPLLRGAARFGLLALVALAVLVSAFVLLAQFMDAGLLEGLQTRMKGIGNSALFRFYQYGNAVMALAEFPLTGMGFSSSAELWSMVDEVFPGKEDFSHPPHNVYLITALEGGLLAGLLFAGSIALLILAYPIRLMQGKPGGDRPRERDALYIALFIFAMASLIYIAPMTRTLWPLGCVLMGVLQAELAGGRAGSRHGRS